MPGRKKKLIPDTVQETLVPSAEQYVPAEMIRPSIPEFQLRVLSYYERSGRHDMPWRHTTDPYRILVSEIMLQQTQVERVTIKYPEFIAVFPDFAALAAAPLVDIIRVWQGMGYNRRAIALQKCAIRVTGEYGGILPRDVDTLATFPGIGHATASSIAAFAFDLPVVFIETNIRRVFIHYFFRDKDSIRDDEIFPLVDQALYRKNPRVWYWALMDLGASLKKSVPNPNRRSAHYTKQSAFEGSDRRIRGQVLKLLVSRGEMTTAAIIRELGEDRVRVLKLLDGLEEEGFIRKTGKKIVLVS
jgi:A/G-specific adenine glycosylase